MKISPFGAALKALLIPAIAAGGMMAASTAQAGDRHHDRGGNYYGQSWGGHHGGGHYYGHYPRYGGGHYYGRHHHHGRGAGYALLGFALGYSLNAAANARSYDGYYGGYYGGQNYVVRPAEPYRYEPEPARGNVVNPLNNQFAGATCLQTREYQTTIIIGGEEKDAYGSACLQPDGSWLQGPPQAVPDF